MKTKHRSHIVLRCLLTVLAAAILTPPARAQVPNLVSYQGRISVGTANFTGTGQFKFALMKGTTSSLLWLNSADTSPANGIPDSAVSLSVNKGLYSVLLGDLALTNMAAIPVSVWTEADVRLRIWFNDGTNGFQLLTPDQRLAPAGYLPEGAVTAEKLAAGSVGSRELARNITLGTTGTAYGKLSFAADSSAFPTVSIDGANYGLFAFGTDGSVRTSLTGGNAGQLTLFNGLSPNRRTVEINASNGTGGYLRANDNSGADRAALEVSATGGMLRLKNAAGAEVIKLQSGDHSWISEGNLGLGTQTPTLAKLVVNGHVNQNAAIFGDVHPVGIQNSYPTIGFNCYHVGGGTVKVHTGGIGGIQGLNYGGLFGLDPYSGNFFLETTDGQNVSHTTATRTRLLDILHNGWMGIGRRPTANKLEVEGEASKTTAGAWLANSDRRIKTDILPITGALATLEKVRPVTFRYTEEYRKAHPGIADVRWHNVIAQEFREVFPDSVKGSGETLPDGSQILQVDTYPATITALAAINELNAKHDAAMKQKDAEIALLKAKVAGMEKHDAAAEARLARLEQAFQQLSASPGKKAALVTARP